MVLTTVQCYETQVSDSCFLPCRLRQNKLTPKLAQPCSSIPGTAFLLRCSPHTTDTCTSQGHRDAHLRQCWILSFYEGFLIEYDGDTLLFLIDSGRRHSTSSLQLTASDKSSTQVRRLDCRPRREMNAM
jgi:hypothetical protein